MGAVQAAYVDGAALVRIAGQYEAAAGIVESAVRTHLSSLSFDGAAAGRAYVTHGDALRHAVDDVAAGLLGWARSAAGIGTELRASAARYARADAHAADRVR